MLRTSWNYANGKQTAVGYQCQASYSIETPDLDGLPVLLVELVAAGANELQAVEFDVRDRPQVEDRARREAVAEGRRLAELYADAAGARLGPVIQIADATPAQSWPHAEGLRGGPASAAPAGEDLAPGQVLVSARVLLRFALDPGQ